MTCSNCEIQTRTSLTDIKTDTNMGNIINYLQLWLQDINPEDEVLPYAFEIEHETHHSDE